MAAEGGAAARALSQREQDIQMMLAADVHLGTKNCDFQMERYVYKRRTDGTDLKPPPLCLHYTQILLCTIVGYR
jgi:small subunit ribosomal protein SAe